jgi:hypothetical protein
MSTIKINKATVATKLNEVVANAKESAKKANEFALKTTEEIVLETITVSNQWQKVTDKALKGGFKLASNQQDLAFNTLETLKAQVLNGRKRLHKLFA